ncbi:vWA domain-containing protein [Zavarzinella formosa]|uniref:vWA domain-containing protein n=1 Tax=Zavarzinella formosa TaxID=360055 RepID=UPI0002EB0883|nr:VWA domain-containing protein [Zavarzinella formosa]
MKGLSPNRFGHRVTLSFANPELLFLLPLPVVVLWWRLRRGPAAIRFPSVEGFGKLPHSRWPVIIGEGGRLIALTAIVVAMAGPRTPDLKTRLTTQGITVVLVLDTSGSMNEKFDWDANSEPISRLQAAKRVFRLFIAGGKGPDGAHFEGRSTDRGTDAVGLVTFATWPQTVCPPTLNHSVVLEILDRTPSASIIDTSTNIGDALAEGLLRLEHASTSRKVLILLSDGEHNHALADPERASLMPRQAARLAAGRGVPIYAIDTGGDPDASNSETRLAGREVNEQIAELTGGRSFIANDGAQLREVCRQIDELERRPVVTPVYRRYHDHAPWFIGTAVLMALLVFSLERTIWRRLP